MQKQGLLEPHVPTTPPVNRAVYGLLTLALFGLGQGIAWTIFLKGCNRDKTESKIDAIADQELGWVFFIAFVVKNAWWLINWQQFWYRATLNMITPDQHLYKIAGQNSNYVIMEQEGTIGKWNRAQRATLNYMEAYPSLAVLGLMAGYVFPKPAFILVCIFVVLRMWMAKNYAQSYEDRMGPYILSMACLAGLESLCLITGVKAVMRGS